MYSQISNIVFRLLPNITNKKIEKKYTIIDKNKDASFSIYLNNYLAFTKEF